MVNSKVKFLKMLVLLNTNSIILIFYVILNSSYLLATMIYIYICIRLDQWLAEYTNQWHSFVPEQIHNSLKISGNVQKTIPYNILKVPGPFDKFNMASKMAADFTFCHILGLNHNRNVINESKYMFMGTRNSISTIFKH